jgi:hypothetical protein
MVKSEDFLTVLLGEASDLYHKQPHQQKNAQAAAIKVLDNHNVQDRPIRKSLLSKICSALGKSGGRTTAARRRQLMLF